MRPIDADGLKKAIKLEWDKVNGDTKHEQSLRGGIRKAVRCIEEAITLDYAPVVHGYWKHEDPVKDDGQKPFVCSSCGLRHPRYGDVDKAYFFHCPWCGIPMDAETDGGKKDER